MGEDPFPTSEPFPTFEIEDLGEALAGPWRTPRNMLAEQEYDSHASLHDDATAQKLGFKGGAVEGPTHYSQFAPLGYAIWGQRWFEDGCCSAHYRSIVYDGEQVRAFIEKVPPGATTARTWMQKEDGTEVQAGTASVGPDAITALDGRLKTLSPLEPCVILRDVKVGMKLPRHEVVMAADQNMGALYPFSLDEKLEAITEPSDWYAKGSPWGAPIIPMEMISVLLQYSSGGARFPTRGPVVGLFADQEIRLVAGPLLVGQTYEIEREVAALSGSRRTESLWVRTSVFEKGSDKLKATMLLNSASFKESYARYAEELATLG
ncbi:MAG: hypothetical protein ACHP7N_19100 [Caulobacterales bacterium]